MINSMQEISKNKMVFVILQHDIHRAEAIGETETDLQVMIYPKQLSLPKTDCFTDECCAKTELYRREFERQKEMRESIESKEDLALFMLKNGFGNDDLTAKYVAMDAFEYLFGYDPRSKIYPKGQ